MRGSVALMSALVLAAGASGAASARPVPSVRIFDLAPVMVRGAHFVAREHITLTLAVGKTTRTRSAVATAAGTFVVGFGTLERTDRCSSSITVSARGAHRDLATFELPSPKCPVSTPGLSVTYSH